MRFVVWAAALASLPALTRAQTVAGLNFTNLADCAQTCLASNTGAAPGCSVNDFGCFCKSTSFIDALSCCLSKTCNTEDQKSSLAFEVALCGTFNISIPSFLGCSPFETIGSSVTGFTIPSGIVTGTFGGTSKSVTTLSSYIPAYTTAGGGAPVNFGGSAIFTGSCSTNAAIASYTMVNGAVQQFPFIGCSNDQAGCCPFEPAAPGPLTQCPLDYYTTSSACCPSGWTVATSPVAGQTYCASSPLLPIYPASSMTGSGAGATVISNQVYSVRYELGEPKKALSTGAIAGIAVGGVAGLLLLGLAGLLCFRSRQRKANKLRNATLPAIAAGGSHSEFSPTKSAAGSPLPNITEQIAEVSGDNKYQLSELPSPPLPSQQISEMYTRTQSPQSMMTATGFAPVSPAMFPQELPGSSHIYEHHPAFQDAAEGQAISPPRTPAMSVRQPDRSNNATPFAVGGSQAGSLTGSPPHTPLPRSPEPPNRSQTSTPAFNPLAAHPHQPESPVLGVHNIGTAE